LMVRRSLRLSRRFAQRKLILTGFVVTISGIVLLVTVVSGTAGGWAFVPGLLLAAASDATSSAPVSAVKMTPVWMAWKPWATSR